MFYSPCNKSHKTIESRLIYKKNLLLFMKNTNDKCVNATKNGGQTHELHGYVFEIWFTFSQLQEAARPTRRRQAILL